mgnify:CR=1 FL=1
MLHIVVIKDPNDIPGLGFLSLGHRIPVDTLKHKVPKLFHGLCHTGISFQMIQPLRMADNGHHQRIDPLGMGLAQHKLRAMLGRKN